MTDNNNTQKNTDENQKQDVFAQNILDKIRQGEVQMHSKFYFKLKVALVVALSLLILVISSFLASFILFGLAVSGRSFLLGFGLRGLEIFFITFPWFALCIEILFIILFRRVIVSFQFGYRSPLAYMLAAIFTLSVLIGLIINETPLHAFLARRAEQDNLPVIGMFYQHVRRPPHEYGAFRGTIISVNGNTFVLQNDSPDATSSDDQTRTIIVPPEISASLSFKVGDDVYVIGDASGTTIRAFGVRELPEPDQDE